MTETARHDQAATDDAGDGTKAALAHRRARPPRVRLGAVDLDRRQHIMAIIQAAHHPHLVIDDDRAGRRARLIIGGIGRHRPFHSIWSSAIPRHHPSRDHETVLGEPQLEALLAEVVRTKDLSGD